MDLLSLRKHRSRSKRESLRKLTRQMIVEQFEDRRVLSGNDTTCNSDDSGAANQQQIDFLLNSQEAQSWLAQSQSAEDIVMQQEAINRPGAEELMLQHLASNPGMPESESSLLGNSSSSTGHSITDAISRTIVQAASPQHLISTHLAPNASIASSIETQSQASNVAEANSQKWFDSQHISKTISQSVAPGEILNGQLSTISTLAGAKSASQQTTWATGFEGDSALQGPALPPGPFGFRSAPSFSSQQGISDNGQVGLSTIGGSALWSPNSPATDGQLVYGPQLPFAQPEGEGDSGDNSWPDTVDYDGWSYTIGGGAAMVHGLFTGATGAKIGLGVLRTAANYFDEFGRCANTLTKLWHGGCFVSGTLVTLSQIPYSSDRQAALWSDTDWIEDRLVATASSSIIRHALASGYLYSSRLQSEASRLLQIPIEQIPIGARISTKNPQAWEYDDSLPEPDQTTWALLSITMYRTDGGIVDAEMIRPRWWIEQHRIEAGKLLPMSMEELQVKGSALVTSIDDCPEIADGEGSVVTARFCTREVHTIAQVEILGPDGQIETLSGTPIHPIWSEDRQDWVPLGELETGEQLRASLPSMDSPFQTSNFPPQTSTVLSVTILSQSLPVYNIEVHGEHVYQVGELGILVHNAYNALRTAMIDAFGKDYMKGFQAAHIIPQNGWAWAPNELFTIIARVRNADLMDDLANGFRAGAGHAGTHTKAYVKEVIDVMRTRTSREKILEGLDMLRKRIEAGDF